MKVCLMIEGQEGVTWDEWRGLARSVEDAGLDGLFRSDHYTSFHGPPGPALDAWSTITALAALTSRIRLGTLVSAVTFRPPSALARMVVTADHVSSGRVELGLGTGWFEQEHVQNGFPFPDIAARFDLLTEYADVVVRSWTEENFDHDGQSFALRGQTALPHPVQQPHPPVILGGSGRRRSVALATRLAAEYNVAFRPPDACRQLRGRLDRACTEAGRDPAGLALSLMTYAALGKSRADAERRFQRAEPLFRSALTTGLLGPVDEVAEQLAAYREAGVTRVFLQHPERSDTDAVGYMGELAAALGVAEPWPSPAGRDEFRTSRPSYWKTRDVPETEERRHMTDTGLNEGGLARLHDALASHVERGALPGLVALVARRGHAHVEVIGAGAFDDRQPLGRDAIFRIASLTKPITAVAAMMLVDDGVLHLDDTVDKWLPELADRRVLRSLGAGLDDTVAAVRPITVDDVLTFRLGFGTLLVPPGTYPIQRAEEELQLKSLGPPWPPTPLTPDGWIQRLGSLPLMHQPGEQWMYNTGAQVLGVLIGRAAGQPLEAFFRERIFGPLGMDDTGFSVPPERLGRLTTAYEPDPESGALHVLDGVEGSYWSAPPTFPCASGWLVSTIDDYWRFVQLMLNRGVYEGVRLLSEASVAQMTTDQLTRAQREANRLFLGEHSGWGLGLSTPAAGDEAPGEPGGYGWDGGTGTTWRSDIDRDITGILFTQRAMTSPEPPEVFADFWHLAYRAIEV